MRPILAIFVAISCALASAEDGAIYIRATIESCPGCSLNRLTDVKNFIYKDVPKYEDVTFKKIQGAVPELVLFNESDEEVERLALSALSRQQCNDLLINKGFKLKPDAKIEL